MTSKRNLGIMALAILCCFLVGTTQTTQAVIPILIVFGLSLLAGFVTGYIIDNFSPPPAGVTMDSHLELFYNAKNNEFQSLTVAMQDQASSVDTMGYYLGRKTEYATMSYLNNTLYPTYPKWQILNASILPELGGMWYTMLHGYTSAVQDAVNYAQISFTGPLNDLDLKVYDGADHSIKAMTNDFQLLYGYGTDAHVFGAGDDNTEELGYIYSNGSAYVFIEHYQGATGNYFDFTTMLQNQLNLSQNYTYSDTLGGQPAWATYEFHKVVLPYGVWKVNFTTDESTVKYRCLTNGLWLSMNSDVENMTELVSDAVNGSYKALNFFDSQNTEYQILMYNDTQCNVWNLAHSIDLAVNFANTLANVYWTTLRNAGIYDISQIPANLVIPLPDFGFISNDDLSKLTQAEIMAMYLAYMKSLGEFFNSSTYDDIITFNYANVTFANLGMIIEGFVYRNNTLITNGSIYLQIYDDACFYIGNNTLNATGLFYNLNTTQAFTYTNGDIINATTIWIRNGTLGTYVNVTYACIEAETIQAYLYNSYSGSGAVPTSNGSAGGSSGLGLLLLIAVIVLLLMGGSRSNSDRDVNIIMPKTRQTNRVIQWLAT